MTVGVPRAAAADGHRGGDAVLSLSVATAARSGVPDAGPPSAAAGDAQRHQDFSRRACGRRRLAGGAARRGPCADRRERCRQVDPDAPGGGGLPARQRHDRAGRRVDRGPEREGRRGRRHRDGLPGAQPGGRAERRRERLCRPPAGQRPRRDPTKPDAGRDAPDPGRSRGRPRPAPAGDPAVARAAADGGDRQRPVPRPQAPDPRRAHLVADHQRGTPPVPGDPAPRRAGRRGDLRLPPHGGDLRDRGSGHGPEGWPGDRRARDRLGHQRRADRAHGRARALLRA